MSEFIGDRKCVRCGAASPYAETCARCGVAQEDARLAWVTFAAAALIGTVSSDYYEKSEQAAGFADAMLAEYHKRYPLPGAK